MSGILKRGYLFDKKVGILPMTVDRKRWYILRQDPTQAHRVMLEFYKDEKAASKGDAPKGFINIRDVVSVHRLTDKKQSFEILCPGIGYRLSANSELEADEWTTAIRAHISYKREDAITNGVKSLSLSRVQSTGSHHQAHLTPPLHERQRTMSEPHHYPLPASAHLQQLQQTQSAQQASFHHHHHQQQLLQQRGIPIVPAHHHAHHPQQHRSNETHPMMHLSHSLPTPPDSLPSPPSFPSFHIPPSFQRQCSLEMAASLPSPSASSDSSSICSGSNTSFEGGGAVFEADGIEMKSVFRVQVKETEVLNVVGPADLVVSEDGLKLHSITPDQQELVFWPLSCLRRYGVNNHCFTIITGRFCVTGEGRFQFYTDESRVIHARVHGYATQKAVSGGKARSLPRRASEPTDFGARSPQQTTPINPTQSLPPHVVTAQARMYHQPSDRSHDYSQLHHFLPPGTVPAHSLAGCVYTHTVTQPVPVGQQIVQNQHYMSHLSPTNQMHSHLLPHQPVTTANMIHASSQAKSNYNPSSPNSIPTTSQFHSEGSQDQSLPEAMKSVSSESSVGSGGDSVGGASSSEASRGGGDSRSPEMLYPISDQEDEPAESTVLADGVLAQQ